MKKLFTIFTLLLTILPGVNAEQRYVGGDVSLLPEYENAGAIYKTRDGEKIEHFLPWCHQQGMNAMRVRLFVDPAAFKAAHPNDYDPNACQDMGYILPLCEQIKEAGLDLMLDFHYSDTWADPAKQWTPEAWKDLNDDQLVQKIYDYTRECLQTLKDAGITPKFIQPGNEISYGMLWGPYNTSNPNKVYTSSNANWERFGRLLNSAIKACREVCPDAEIIIHVERVAQPEVLKQYYNKMASLGVDYDIIGLSYYPYWHGDLSVLDTALATLESSFPNKPIMIVETGYPIKWAIPGSDYENTSKWPYTDAGQNKFAQDLVATLEKHSQVNGLFWWWMEYNPFNTSLSGWYNAPLIDPSTGRVTSAFTTICSFANDTALDVPVVNNDSEVQWYDLQGHPVEAETPGLQISTQGKRLVR